MAKSSKYFSEAELSCHCCQGFPSENGVDDKLLAVLDSMREAINRPMSISCAYRCPSHNANVGGVPNSQHVDGTAADVILPDDIDIEDFAKLAEACGADGVGIYYDSSFVHVDTRGSEARWTDRD